MMAPEAPMPTSLCGPRMYEPTLPPSPASRYRAAKRTLPSSTSRAGPTISRVIMLKKMCSKLACNHIAVKAR